MIRHSLIDNFSCEMKSDTDKWPCLNNEGAPSNPTEMCASSYKSSGLQYVHVDIVANNDNSILKVTLQSCEILGISSIK